MALSVGTITRSTQDVVTPVAAPCGRSGVLSTEADTAPAASWSITAEQGTPCPLRPGPQPGAGSAAGARRHPPSALCCSTTTPLCRPRAGNSPVTLSPGGWA